MLLILSKAHLIYTLRGWPRRQTNKPLGIKFHHTNISTLRTNYDLGINATTSGLRLDSLRLTADKANCWILEKILSQNAADLDEIISVTEHCEKVWVNYMMRELTWLQDLKHEISKEKIRTIKLEGMNWSLACNLIHHLDFAT